MTAAAGERTEMLLFRQGGELFALALRAALEVRELPALEAVPDARVLPPAAIAPALIELCGVTEAIA